MPNLDVRKRIATNLLKHWQIAEELNINEAVFSRWMRKELPPDRRMQVLAAIEKLSKEIVSNG